MDLQLLALVLFIFCHSLGHSSPVALGDVQKGQEDENGALARAGQFLFNAAIGVHESAKKLFGFKMAEESEKVDPALEKGQESHGLLGKSACKVGSAVLAEFEKILRALLGQERAGRVVEAFAGIAWTKIADSIRSKEFAQAVQQLRKPFDVLLAELVGGDGELLGKRGQDLRFVNALVLLVLQYFVMPVGCLQQIVTRLYDIQKISQPLALKFITTLHPQWKGKEAILVQEMVEKNKDWTLTEMPLNLSGLKLSELFFAMLRGNGKEVGELVKEEAKQQLKRALGEGSTGLFKMVLQNLLKSVPAKFATWAPVLFEQQINSATSQLADQIAPALASQLPSIVELLLKDGQKL